MRVCVRGRGGVKVYYLVASDGERGRRRGEEKRRGEERRGGKERRGGRGEERRGEERGGEERKGGERRVE